MRIVQPEPTPALRARFVGDLQAFAEQPDRPVTRPCPGCTLRCPGCGSLRCLCHCAPDCAAAPRMMSSDPDRHPIEPGIAPLVYALHATEGCTPCWSCEGHRRDDGRLKRLPQVWFVTDSLVMVRLIQERIGDLWIARRLGTPWRVRVIYTDDVFSPHTTFTIEPALAPGDRADLSALRDDAREIANGFATALRRLAATHLRRTPLSVP